MKITIENCNNIDKGEVTLVNSKLNIKFGINGIGKSTIAKAIQFHIDNDKNLKDLLPFKLQGNNPGNLQPKINFDEALKTILVFNEDYLNQFVYKPDELISNSFEIFIETPAYIESIKKIESILEGIKNVFLENQELEKIISDFEVLQNGFKTTQSGLSKTAPISKALLENGNQIENIPDSLKGYSSFLKNENCIRWLDWQIKGESFLDISDDCPYCTSTIKETKETIKSVSKTYNKKIIGDFTKIINAIENLGDYFSDEAKIQLESITKKHSELEVSEKNYIVVIKHQIDDFLSKLKSLRDISPKEFKENRKVKEKLEKLKINIGLFDKFKSNKTEEIICSLNDSLDQVLTKVGELQGEVNKQESKTQKLIEKHKEDINEFFRNAGYKYKIVINDEDDEYKIKLQHIDWEENISGGDQYLSFGEKNAFALVLFMYQALSETPDLIILDDPISSFDKNKKYAVMNMLFRSDKCLKNKTVLMLTHDIDPVIDAIRVLKEFKNLANGTFLYFKDGELEEKTIRTENLVTFAQICKEVLALSDIDSIIKCIYLRRHYEIIDDKGDAYEVLSNLFHKRSKDKAEDHRNTEGDNKMHSDAFEKGEKEIKEKFSDFDYDGILANISNDNEIKRAYKSSKNSYEKLQLFKILNNARLDTVLNKFINESYHIENEFVIQLNPMDFDLVPAFIIEQCNQIIAPNENDPD